MKRALKASLIQVIKDVYLTQAIIAFVVYFERSILLSKHLLKACQIIIQSLLLIWTSCSFVCEVCLSISYLVEFFFLLQGPLVGPLTKRMYKKKGIPLASVIVVHRQRNLLVSYSIQLSFFLLSNRAIERPTTNQVWKAKS